MKNKVIVFWFRRDLRIDDNVGFNHALNSGLPVLPIFIFDTNLIKELKPDDARLNFIHMQVLKLDKEFKKHGGSLKIFFDKPELAFEKLLNGFEIAAVYTNRDYEPYATNRDQKISEKLKTKGVDFLTFKDQVIYEKDEILKSNNEPYTVYTPYKNKWLQQSGQNRQELNPVKVNVKNLFQHNGTIPSLAEIGFKNPTIKVRDFTLEILLNYDKNRNIPALDATSYLGPHLRFGTIGIRKLISLLGEPDTVFLNELIWREFFMQILAHFPRLVHENFKTKYDNIIWLNNTGEFKRWCNGQTGYPMVDAGMRQLNETGYMHNRVRMVVASFLCKHLLIDWQWGEAYFAEKLLDFELSSNNGNWQWAAGTGCDAAPYFRVFNPMIQQQKFDPKMEYIQKWIPEIGSKHYPEPIVEHSFARERAIETYKIGLNS